MEGQIESMKKGYQIKVEGCFQGLQQTIEESYNNIDQALDDFLNDHSNHLQLESILSQLQQDSPFNFQSDHFQNQFIQEVTSLINNQIQQKDHHIRSLNIQQNIQQSPTLQTNNQPFTYQLLQNSIKQNEYCYAIAINKDCSIMVAASDSLIKVFEFNQGIIKQVQLLNEHQKYVYFMKRSNHFISGGFDGNENNSWIYQQKLIGHTNIVLCLVSNNNEDVIVSGNYDKTIKFWIKQNDWKCSQTITDHTGQVCGLSVNEQQNRVISCGQDNIILVMEQSEQNKQWQVIQKIQMEQGGYRICFIDNNTFIFQPYQGEQIHVFEMNNTNKQQIKTKDIQVKKGLYDELLFPQQYIKQKCILVNKYAQNVNLIRMKQNGEFIIEHYIRFKTSKIFGCMSDDGQYLITWEDKSRVFQIRKYMQT